MSEALSVTLLKQIRAHKMGGSLLPPPTSPMAVARAFVEDRCTHKDGLTLGHWRGTFWQWKTSHWVEVEDRTVRSQLYGFIENATYDADGTPMPWLPTRRKIGDLLEALASCRTICTSRAGSTAVMMARSSQPATGCST
jgi:putative DNA primase/helicase